MLTVVGIGADGWPGLGEEARAVLQQATAIHGAARQLALLPETVTATRNEWPSPMVPAVDALVQSGADAVVLASGDPTLHGVATTIITRAGADNVRVLPHVSSCSLACARMGWPQQDVELVSLVGRPPEHAIRSLQPGRRLVVLVSGPDGPAALARAVTAHGAGASPFTVLEHLGADDERRHDTTASRALDHTAGPLALVALTVAGGRAHPRTPGLPDDAFVASDGQLTKRHIRAMTLAALGPLPGELLWDVGAGNGSIAIEWLRAEHGTRAVAIEHRADRLGRIAQNAAALGVPQLRIVEGRAPAALAGLDEEPDVVFVGGGLTEPGLLDAVMAALRPGGRLVANTVTLESEQAAVAAQKRYGGTLTKIDVAHAEPIGTFTGWRAQMTVVQWATTKDHT